MVTIIQAKSENDLTLGRQGENLARQVVFDLSAWEAEYGPGTAELIHQRPGDASPYPVAAVREGSTLVWTLTSADTDFHSDYGSCELRYYVGDVLVKSRTWLTKVIRAMSTPSETAPPEPEQGWVERVLEAGVSAKEAAERAEKAAIHQPYPNAETETWWVWDPESGEYRDSGMPCVGEIADHSRLAGRDAEDQHPISAITQLSKELSNRMQIGDTISALDIIKMMEG